MKTRKQLIVACAVLILGIITFIVIPALPGILPFSEKTFISEGLAEQWFSVFLGFVFTAIITYLLLSRQSQDQLDISMKEKVYEEKLKIYKDYLDVLKGIIEDRRLSTEEETKLRIETAKLAVHTDSRLFERICQRVKDLIMSMCSDDDDCLQAPVMDARPDGDDDLRGEGEKTPNYSKKERRSGEMLAALMEVVTCIKIELYSPSGEIVEKLKELDSKQKFYSHSGKVVAELEKLNLEKSGVSESIQSVLAPFTELFILADRTDQISEDPDLDADINSLGIPTENRLLSNWDIKINDSWYLLIATSPKIGGEWGKVYIRPWGARCAICAYHSSGNDKIDCDFSRELKWQEGGKIRREKTQWRDFLEDNDWEQKVSASGEEFRLTSPNDFRTKYENDRFFRTLVNAKVRRLIVRLENYHRAVVWKERLSKVYDDVYKKDIPANTVWFVHSIYGMWLQATEEPAKWDNGYLRLRFSPEEGKVFLNRDGENAYVDYAHRFYENLGTDEKEKLKEKFDEEQLKANREPIELDQFPALDGSGAYRSAEELTDEIEKLFGKYYVALLKALKKM